MSIVIGLWTMGFHGLELMGCEIYDFFALMFVVQGC